MSRFLIHFLITFSVSFIFMYVFVQLFVDVYAIPLRDINGIFIMSVLITLTEFILKSKKEPSIREMLIRRLIHMFVVVGIIVSTAIFMGWISWQYPIRVILFAGAVAVVYITYMAVDWQQSKGLAKRLNKKLSERYK